VLSATFAQARAHYNEALPVEVETLAANQFPITNAGENQTVDENEAVSLHATGSTDLDGEKISEGRPSPGSPFEKPAPTPTLPPSWPPLWTATHPWSLNPSPKALRG